MTPAPAAEPRRRRRLRSAAAAVAVGALASLAAASPAAATAPGDNGAIAFVREGDVWLVGEDGTGARRLTTDPASEASPAWSPDGTRVAFERLVGARPQIFVAGLDGAPAEQLTEGDMGSRDPAWSPDGTRIAFSREAAAMGWDLVVMEADGGAPALVRAGDPARLRGAEWTPDGEWILFGEIYDNGLLSRVRPDGRDYAPLGGPPVLGSGGNWWEQPSAAPDGSRVAFAQRQYDETEGEVPGAQRLGTMRPDGTDVRLLPAHGRIGEQPSWSPDGARIAFESDLDGDDDLWTMLPDGSDVRRVTDLPGDETEPAWQPVRADPAPAGSAGPLLPAASGATALTAAVGLAPRPALGPRGATDRACRRTGRLLATNARRLRRARAAVRTLRAAPARRAARRSVARLTATRARIIAVRRRECARR